MAFTPFDLGLGSSQGRIQPANAQPSQGDWLFVLGSDVPGFLHSFNIGDQAEISQSITPEGATELFRFRARLRGPASMPGDAVWKAKVLLGATEVIDVPLTPGVDRIFEDLAFNHDTFGSPFTLTFRLELEGTAVDPIEVELPAFYIDEVLEDTAPADVVLINRDPFPDETQVPAGTLIALELTDPAGSGISTADTEVRVNGVLAYDGDGGGFQTGFDGPGSATSAPTPATFRIVIDPTTDFTSEELVTILVDSQSTAGGSSPVQDSYSFTIEDLTAPVVLSATGQAKDRVRVTFSEPVKQVAVANADDSLNPANYVFQRLTIPSVDVVPVSVVPVSASEVEIATDIELTFGADYRVTVSNVEDIFDNPIGSPNNAAFVAFAPTFPDGRRFELIDFLPKMNVREDETGDLQKFIACFQEVTNLLLCEIDQFSDILDPDFAPEPFVDAMLCDLGNPFAFSEELSLIDKRRLLRVLVDIYKLKGTAPGIIDVVRFFLGIEITIQEPLEDGWILGDSELGIDTFLAPSDSFTRFSFEIVSPVALTQEQRDRIFAICEYMKPAHTHCVRIVEPTIPTVPDHWELGLSELGTETLLH